MDEGTTIVTGACGFVAEGTEDEVVAVTQAHGRELHNMDVTREQVLAMARRAAP